MIHWFDDLASWLVYFTRFLPISNESYRRLLSVALADSPDLLRQCLGEDLPVSRIMAQKKDDLGFFGCVEVFCCRLSGEGFSIIGVDTYTGWAFSSTSRRHDAPTRFYREFRKKACFDVFVFRVCEVYGQQFASPGAREVAGNIVQYRNSDAAANIKRYRPSKELDVREFVLCVRKIIDVYNSGAYLDDDRIAPISLLQDLHSDGFFGAGKGPPRKRTLQSNRQHASDEERKQSNRELAKIKQSQRRRLLRERGTTEFSITLSSVARGNLSTLMEVTGASQTKILEDLINNVILLPVPDPFVLDETQLAEIIARPEWIKKIIERFSDMRVVSIMLCYRFGSPEDSDGASS